MTRRTWRSVVVLALLLGVLLASASGSIAAQPPVVGLVINEVGNSITAFDPADGHVLGSTDISQSLSKPHLSAFDPTTHRLFVGSKGAKLAAFDVTDPAAPELIESVTPGGDGEIHWVVLAAGLVWLAHQGDSAVYAYDPTDLSAPVVTLGKDQHPRARPPTRHRRVVVDQSPGGAAWVRAADRRAEARRDWQAAADDRPGRRPAQ
jgi:streptogramin lyase